MKASELRAAIERKTDCRVRLGKHANYAIFLDGQKVITRVVVPHGRKDLTPGVEGSARQRLRLNRDQFKAFVSCTMTKTGYEEVLRSKNLTQLP